MLLDCLGPPIEGFLLHIELFDLLLQLVVKVHHLRLFLLKLSVLLPESSFFHDKVPATVLRIFKLYPELVLRLIHFAAELLSTDLHLLQFNLELLHLFNRLSFFALRSLSDPIFIAHDPLDFYFKVDCAIPYLTIVVRSIGLF